MLYSEHVALTSRIGIVAASVACAYGQGAEVIRDVPLGNPVATKARTVAMAICTEIFAPGSLSVVAGHFKTDTSTILDAVEISAAWRAMDDNENQTWRMLGATAMGLLSPMPRVPDESEETETFAQAAQ